MIKIHGSRKNKQHHAKSQEHWYPNCAPLDAGSGLLAVFSGHMAFCSDNQFTGYDLISAGNNLALKIYDVTSKKENVIMSPYSVTSALGLLYMMADGSTAQELTKILGITTSRYQNVAEAYRQAMQCLGTSKQDLHMANGIFMDWRIPMKESFKNFIRRQIDAQSENVDLSNRIEDTRRYINRWVDQNTQHMIPEFLDEDFSRSGPKLAVLCSAVHFKKDWARPFKKTTREKFFSEDGTSSTVDMMSCDDTRFGIASFREIGATALRIDYKGRTQSMIALLPEGKTTVEDLAKKLKRVNLMEDILKKIPVGTDLGQEIHVSMPKFNISSKFQLLDILTEQAKELTFVKNKLMSEGLQDIESQKDGELDVPISVVSCFLFS
ncbi:hypothetical protein AAG570_010245 [Ranatra chinensis]|uniref:Serpin domain-containing protein n=1 Tax=Ranatra chinensis TaxID=642074 RepID=A0ABD0YM00_9HEMI